MFTFHFIKHDFNIVLLGETACCVFMSIPLGLTEKERPVWTWTQHVVSYSQRRHVSAALLGHLQVL